MEIRAATQLFEVHWSERRRWKIEVDDWKVEKYTRKNIYIDVIEIDV